MINDLKTYKYLIDDLFSSEVNLLKNELGFLLRQYIFNSTDLKLLMEMDIQQDISFSL
jgi:hypothetical protein